MVISRSGAQDRMGTSAAVHLARRRFLAGTAALGAASVGGLVCGAAADPPPETRRIRLVHAPSICLAPQYISEALLRLEGFSEVEYVELSNLIDPSRAVAAGRADISMDAAPVFLPQVDAGQPIVVLAGLHGGCYELFAHEPIRAIRDLRGRRVGIAAFNSADHVFIASIVAYVGMDPRKDVKWVVADDPAGAVPLFISGKVDAVLAFPPEPQDLRAKKIGRVIVDTTQDRPWSQYFCCMLSTRQDFIHNYPVATKRALRAMLKAADICALEPQRAARLLVAREFEPRYEVALEVLRKVDYTRWRDANPEDSLRFHALRLHEVGMIKSTPQRIIAQGTDWRFLNEVKKELKA
jgi:NitT/TauT family transport system substrate-binding protein